MQRNQHNPEEVNPQTDKEKTRLQIQDTYAFIEAVLENIPDMIFVKEAKELRFVRFNKAGEQLIGIPRKDMIGRNDFDFFPKTEAEFFTSMDREVLKSGKLLDIPEEPIETRKGQRILHTKKIPIYSETGEPAYLLGISEDITEKKRMEEVRMKLLQERMARREAEKSIKLRNDFISIVSHELNTPLTAVLMQNQILSKQLAKVEFAEKEKLMILVAKSLGQIYQFSKLVNELLDILRISTGHLVLIVEDCDLSDLVRKVVEQWQMEITDASPNIVQKLSEAKGKWDPLRLEQVIMNLLTNAVKYGSGKPVEISTHVHEGKVKLIVRDQGIGISPDDQKKIFQRFGRASPITKYRGLGLGLFFTHEIVSAHGGSLYVESELGKGATFTVELPLETKNV